VGPEDLEATVAFVKTLKSPFEYNQEGRIQKVTK
jgi:2',3'-cyclic-nucleotide 2'-phosphodiesterase / 3'-nucleotidase / 5'-nucleotidase